MSVAKQQRAVTEACTRPYQHANSKAAHNALPRASSDAQQFIPRLPGCARPPTRRRTCCRRSGTAAPPSSWACCESQQPRQQQRASECEHAKSGRENSNEQRWQATMRRPCVGRLDAARSMQFAQTTRRQATARPTRAVDSQHEARGPVLLNDGLKLLVGEAQQALVVRVHARAQTQTQLDSTIDRRTVRKVSAK